MEKKERTYTAAVSVGIALSHRKNATIKQIEIISGASTIADAHPLDEPDVKEKIKRIKAAEGGHVNNGH